MTAYNKIREYLDAHKTPVTVAELVKRFLIRRETVGEIFRKLEAEGFAQRNRIDGKNRWSKKGQEKSYVAVSHRAHRLNEYIPEHVKKSSYTHIRGYDD